MNNYINKALRTESIEGASDRLDLVMLSRLFQLNKDLVNIVEHEADNLKKHIFYGKPINTKAGVRTGLNTKDLSVEQIRLLHAGLGMLTEAQEFLKPVLDCITLGSPLDMVNLQEELGDMMWYEAIACDTMGTTFEEEQTRNIEKLTARYPEKFTQEAALNRDLDTERKILES